jgi:hypothetical protein
VGLKEARVRRAEKRKLLTAGIDPSEHKKATKSAKADRADNSFEVVAGEWFAKYSPGWAEKHRENIIRRLERDVFPWIGGRPISELAAPNCSPWSAELSIGARWRLHTVRSATVARCSAMPWPPVVASETRPTIFAALCLRSKGAT